MIDEKVLIARLEEEKECYLQSKVVATRCGLLGASSACESKAYAIEEAIDIVNQLAEEQKQCIKSSCSNCETYDNEKHYCPKWCDVIENTVKELAEESNKRYEPTIDLIEYGVDGYNLHLKEQYRKGYEDAKKDNVWIPCSERLPDKEVDVLVCFSNAMDFVIAYRTKMMNANLNDVWVNSSTAYIISSDVLAWMPLPAPFKPKGE